MKNRETELRAAINRLEKSTGRIARKNARNALNRLLKAMWREADAAYPPIRKDGTEVVRVKKRGVCCPICDVPLKGFKELARHARVMHECRNALNGDAVCWCGVGFFDSRRKLAGGNKESAVTKLGRHLAGVGRENLKAHAVVGALGGR